LWLRLRAGHAVLRSAHPVHTLWLAHRHTAADRFADARAALARREPQAVRIGREGWTVAVVRIDAATAGFECNLLRGAALSVALDEAAAGFEFEAWLVDSLRRGALGAVEQQAPS
jgi:hypothetical protein